MRNHFYKLLFLLVILLSLPRLYAQVEWDLILDSISNERILMRLHAYNAGSIAWTYTFPQSPWCSYTIDGEFPASGFFPVITHVSLEPQQHYYCPMEYHSVLYGYLSNGAHSIQAALMYSHNAPSPVGQPQLFYMPVNQYDSANWNFIFTEVSPTELSMYLSLENAVAQALTFSFDYDPFYSYTLDGEVFFPEPLALSPVMNMAANEYRRFPLITHPQPLLAGNHNLQIYINSSTGEPWVPVGDEIRINVADHTQIDIGAGDILARVPLDFYWRNNLYQCILSPQDFDHHGGVINAISFYSNFYSFHNAPCPVRIFMKHTTADDLAEGWVPVSQEDLVFNGIKYFANGADIEQKFWLQQPFIYDGVSNVALLVERVWTLSYYTSAEQFKAQACAPERARKAVSDAVHYDPLALPAANDAQLIAQMPKMTIYFDSNTMDIGGNTDTPAPDGIALKAYPNPFVQALEMEIDLAKNTEIKLEIYNLRGQKQKSFVAGSLARGKHSFTWDGRDAQGNKVPAGIYLCRVQVAGKVEVRKIVRM